MSSQPSKSNARTESTKVPSNRPEDPLTDADRFLSPPQAPNEVGRLGPYRVLGVLGRGGMGAVYRAEDPRLNRQVAIKVLLPDQSTDPRAKARFRREAKAQAQVEHDHIIPIYEVEEVNGVAYIAMPLLKGQTLAAALKQNPRPPVAEVVRVGREVADGLAAAHAAGLIHRDIKPANVWLEGARRRVKILDFGLARGAGAEERLPPSAPAAEPDRTEPLTRAGAVMGTPAYMSPEQARGEPVDHRSDVFSLGVLLYEMATGQKPFTGQTSYEVLVAVATHEPRPAGELNPNLPPALSDLIRRMLAKPPAARAPSAEAVAKELKTIEANLILMSVQVIPLSAAPDEPNPWDDIDLTVPVTGTIAPALDSPPKPRTRHSGPRRDTRRLWVAVAAPLLVAIVAVGAWRLTKAPPDVATGDEPQKSTLSSNPAPKGKFVPKADPDLALATLILSKKGLVRVDSNPGYVSTLTELPDGAFKLTAVHMHPPTTVELTDDELEKFDGVDGLVELRIHGGRISDDGVIKLLNRPFAPKLKVLQFSIPELTDRGATAVARCTALTTLTFYHCPRLTDDGLSCLAALAQLRHLSVGYATSITGAGLKHLHGANLTRLQFYNTRVTDAIAPHLDRCPELTELNLVGAFADPVVESVAKMTKLQTLGLTSPSVSDRALELVSGLPNVTDLSLSCGAISDTGLGHIGRMTRLTNLYIGGTISDAGLEQLHALKLLRSCQLTYATGVTYAALRTFRAAIPACTVTTDLDQKADRKAAEWVLARGGQVDAGAARVNSIKALPQTFELKGVILPNSSQALAPTDLDALRYTDRLTTLLVLGPGVTDAGLKALAGFGFAPRLRNLALDRSAVTDGGLAELPTFAALTDLALSGAPVRGPGLAACRRLPNLLKLTLDGTKVTDDGVKHLRGLKLLHLDLSNTGVTGAAADDLATLSALTDMRLDGCAVTDADLLRLAPLTKLAALDVSNTKVTKAGADALLANLPGCLIKYPGGTAGPKK